MRFRPSPLLRLLLPMLGHPPPLLRVSISIQPSQEASSGNANIDIERRRCGECGNFHTGACWPICDACGRRHLGDCPTPRPPPSKPGHGPSSSSRPGPTSASFGRFGGSGQCLRRGRLLLSAPLYLLGRRPPARQQAPPRPRQEAQQGRGQGMSLYIIIMYIISFH